MRIRFLLPAAALFVLPMACKQDVSEEGDAAGEGADSAEVIGGEASTFVLFTDGSEAAGKVAATPTGPGVAAYMATRVGSQMTPAGCVTATVSGASVTYVFDNCVGPRGLVHLTGTVLVDYSVDVQGIHAHATATGFAVNQSTVSIDSTATYSTSGVAKTLTVATQGSGTGPLGNTFNRQGNYTVSWTPTCVTLNGTWSTSTALWTRSTQVTNLTRCKGSCPANGGSISHTFRTGATLTISYDGSDVAHWSTSGGLSGTINLPCTPA